jgi:hypothetical protein
LLDFTCTCGRSYHFPAAAAGKKARCSSCAAVFEIPTAPAPAATPAPTRVSGGPAPTGPSGEDFELAPTARSQRPAQPRSAPHLPRDVRAGLSAPSEPEADPHFGGFWADAALAFVFFRRPRNLVVWLCAAAMLVVPVVIPLVLITLLASIVVFGLIVGFYMRALAGAAGGEDELPDLVEYDNWLDDLIVPLLKWVCTGLVAAAPAIIAAIALSSAGQPEDTVWLVSTGVAIAGFYLWPSLLLQVSLMGLSAAIRVDVAARTAFAAPLAYAGAFALIVLAIGVNTLANGAIGPQDWQDAVESFWSSVAPVGSLTYKLARFGSMSLIETYAMIVAMRVTGLFYHHYKDRLPWSAG